MEMNKIVEALRLAKDEFDYGFIEVTIPGQTGTEIIVNQSSSLDNKIAYYQKAYGDNGVHCMNDQIRIISAGAVSEMRLLEFAE